LQFKDVLLFVKLRNSNIFFNFERINMFDSPPLDRQTAHRLLKQYEEPGAEDALDRASIRQALLSVASLSDYQIFGVCADTMKQGIEGLAGYAEALGYSSNLKLEALEVSAKQHEGAVYIKFNPNSAQCYTSPYEGEHRGVLVACQSAAETDINEIYGHLPLDLFR
jgi:Domain of unknown function (DUF1824)